MSSATIPAKPRALPAAAPSRCVGEYLIDRLYELGVRHVFGVPGDYVLQFYSMLEASPIEVVGTTREDSAGFAADAYARVSGLGAVCITCCVGGLNVCNPIAGAFAEKSPVVVISGAPGIGERVNNPLLHHKVRDFSTQREVFDRLTAATAELDDPWTAFREIDRVLEVAVRYKRPVFIELPRDRVRARSVVEPQTETRCPGSDPLALSEALDESLAMIHNSRQPVILAGVEIHRFGLQNELLRLAEQSDVPIATTLLGKSVISERHPLHLGVYAAAMGREEVCRRLEDSDCLILLGASLTDIDLGIAAAAFDPARCIHATSERLRIRNHLFPDVLLHDFVRELALRARVPPAISLASGCPRGEGTSLKLAGHQLRLAASPEHVPAWRPKPASPIAVKRLFERLATFLTDEMVVIADVGDALIGAIDLPIWRQTEFLSPAYYTTMGFAVPAALGAKFANQQLRPLVLVGDGAFQMTGMELSTIARHGQNPIVLVLNNEGYGTERLLLAGAFNDIHNWQYHRIPELLGTGWGREVRTEGELEESLQTALENAGSFSLLNIRLAPDDRSEPLDRLARRLAQRV